MSSNKDFFYSLIGLVAESAIYGAVAYGTYAYLTASNSLSSDQTDNAKKWIDRANSLGRCIKSLDKYEMMIAQDVIDPDSIDVSFDMIGGLDEAKLEILNMISAPIRHPEFFRGRRLLSFPKGILLYGPPGTGKTMLVKAIAKESGAMFINLQLSTVFNMYLGESEKLIHALFTLAEKLAPCILFIDEVDSFLKQRGSEHEAYSNVKAEFLQLWDGLLSSSNNGIVVVGASNRPRDIDDAFLRRLSRQYLIPLPVRSDFRKEKPNWQTALISLSTCDRALQLHLLILFQGVKERESIMRLMLKDERVSQVDLPFFAERTAGYSGSDLKELCQVAAWEPLWEVLKDEMSGHYSSLQPPVRPIETRDFLKALEKVRPTGTLAREYEDMHRVSGSPAAGEDALPQ